MKKQKCLIYFSVVLMISAFGLCFSKSKTQSNPLIPGKTITYSDNFFFQNLNSTIPPNIKIDTALKAQYEFLSFPVNWIKPKGQKYRMAVFHTNKNYRKAKNVFVFVLGGPGDHISYMKAYADKIYKNLGKNWDVVIFDQRGCGLSGFKLNGNLVNFKYLTMSQAIGDIYALIKRSKKRGAKHVVLGGVSSGAFIALKYGEEHSGSINMLYIDGGAASANFVNESAKLAINTISKKLRPETIKSIADYYGVDKDVLFEYLWWTLAKDPLLKSLIWYNLKNKNEKGRDALKKYFKNSIIIPPFKDKKKLLDNLISLWRLYYIGCLEIIPKPKNQKKYQYNYFKSYNMILSKLAKKYHLKWAPFNFKKELSKITTKFVITDGLDDKMVPFEESKAIYLGTNNDKVILLGFKNTGHGAMSKHTSIITSVIKTYLNKPKATVKSMIFNNNNIVWF